MFLVQRIHADTKVPAKAHASDAAYDLFAYLENGASVTLKPGERMAIPTGFKMAMHPQTFGLILPRSGLALKNGLDVLAGVIDSGYRDEVKVILINHGQEPIEIHHGMKMAQMAHLPLIVDGVTVVENLANSDRGLGGFGSTGLQ